LILAIGVASAAIGLPGTAQKSNAQAPKPIPRSEVVSKLDSAFAAADALSALANLGFKPAEASAAVNAAQDDLGPDAGLDALVRLALKKAAK
jgi:Holliday junction resolvasome RuvABC DNA-binding subunit